MSLDLVGYWRMDEGTGTTVKDYSGNGNDGTITNGAEWITVMDVTETDHQQRNR